jgi:predicted lipid-binding transport protein (Tim44 family)
MNQRYRVLRIVGGVLKVMGGLVGIVTVIAAFAFCVIGAISGAAVDNFGTGSGANGTFGGILGGLMMGVFILLYGGFVALYFFGLGELMYLLISVEEHTRITATVLQQQFNQMRSASATAATPPASRPAPQQSLTPQRSA